MKKFLLTAMALVLMLSLLAFAGCGKPSNSTGNNGGSSGQSDQNQPPRLALVIKTSDQYDIEINTVTKTKDTGGADAVLFTLTLNNKTDQDATFASLFTASASQAGQGLQPANVVSETSPSGYNLNTIIPAGNSLKVQYAYLTIDQSPVSIEIRQTGAPEVIFMSSTFELV